jgi:hypothetical protein
MWILRYKYTFLLFSLHLYTFHLKHLLNFARLNMFVVKRGLFFNNYTFFRFVYVVNKETYLDGRKERVAFDKVIMK